MTDQAPRFVALAQSKEEEDQYDLKANRVYVKASGVLGSVMNMVKGALGAGILGSHVAYMEAGALVGLIINIMLGVYMTYCLYILGKSAQTLYKRCRVPTMSYSDVGEAAMAVHSNKIFSKFSRCFRYSIDVVICMDLFGSCCCYQLIIANTIKQVVENKQKTTVEGMPGYPNLRMYLLMIMIPCVLICMIRHLGWLAPFSLVGNILVLMAIIMTIFYSLKTHPKFDNLYFATTAKGTFKYIGMIVFSMSCAGVVLPIENNMKEPNRYGTALVTGMATIVAAIATTGFFGFNAYRTDSEAPITLNFPLDTAPIILKVCIAVMVYITHALNFWVPFNLTFYYLKKLHKPENHVKMEYVYRAIIVILITCLGILFPDVSKVMSFLGCFCLTNMAFMWPVCVFLLVHSERPGLGVYKWKLIWGGILITIGFILFMAGSMVAIQDLASLFGKTDKMIDEINAEHERELFKYLLYDLNQTTI